MSLWCTRPKYVYIGMCTDFLGSTEVGLDTLQTHLTLVLHMVCHPGSSLVVPKNRRIKYSGLEVQIKQHGMKMTPTPSLQTFICGKSS